MLHEADKGAPKLIEKLEKDLNEQEKADEAFYQEIKGKNNMDATIL